MLTMALARGGEAGAHFLGPIIFLGIIGLFLFLMARRWRRHGYAHAGSSGYGQWKSPGMRILEERYANGEIDRDEYFARKADLATTRT